MVILLLGGLEHFAGGDDTKCVGEGQGTELAAKSATASVSVMDLDSESDSDSDSDSTAFSRFSPELDLVQEGVRRLTLTSVADAGLRDGLRILDPTSQPAAERWALLGLHQCGLSRNAQGACKSRKSLQRVVLRVAGFAEKLGEARGFGFGDCFHRSL